MTQKGKSKFNIPLLLACLGLIAGIGLMFSDQIFIGILGSIASAGLIYKSYTDMKALKDQGIN